MYRIINDSMYYYSILYLPLRKFQIREKYFLQALNVGIDLTNDMMKMKKKKKKVQVIKLINKPMAQAMA